MKRAEREAALNSDLLLSGVQNQDLGALTQSILNKQESNGNGTNNPSSIAEPDENMDEESLKKA